MQAVIATLTVLVLLASVLAVVANIQRDQAVYQRDVAISAQLSIQSEDVGDSNPVISRLLSVAAWDIHQSGQAYDAMVAAATLPGIAVLSAGTGPVNTVTFSRDGRILASGGEDGTIRLWDVAAHQEIGGPINADAGSVDALALSHDGKILAAGYDDGTIRLWDMTTRRQIGGPRVTTPCSSR